MARNYICDACGITERNEDVVAPPADWITLIRESGSAYESFTEWHACTANCAEEILHEEFLP